MSELDEYAVNIQDNINSTTTKNIDCNENNIDYNGNNIDYNGNNEDFNPLQMLNIFDNWYIIVIRSSLYLLNFIDCFNYIVYSWDGAEVTTLSTQTFNKLAQESVELIKARETIEKLEQIIRGKAAENNALKQQMERKKESQNISVCV